MFRSLSLSGSARESKRDRHRRLLSWNEKDDVYNVFTSAKQNSSIWEWSAADKQVAPSLLSRKFQQRDERVLSWTALNQVKWQGGGEGASTTFDARNLYTLRTKA
jgi:hypothetical protein